MPFAEIYAQILGNAEIKSYLCNPETNQRLTTVDKTRLFLLLAATMLLAACGNDDNDVRPEDDTSINANANDASGNADLARWELPHSTAGNLFIPHRTSDGLMNYCMEYSLTANHSQWVAYRYDTKLASSVTSRSDAWSSDPALNNYRDHQVSTGYFPGYNRGHLVGSAERYYSREANEQTFYMSNMSPMLGEFNTNDWGNGIETLIREWGRAMANGDTLYVVKGGTIGDPLGYISVNTTSGKTVRMTVPRHYFAACLKRLASGYLYAIGFWIEHKDHRLGGDKQKAKALARESACTVDELERLTGLDFFCNVPDTYETRVEAKMDVTEWSGL